MKINSKHGNLHITIDTKRNESELIAAQKYLDQIVIRDTEPFVPFNQGILRNSAKYASEVGEGKIVYKTPYAHYLYKGMAMIGIESRSSYAKHEEPKVYSGKTLNYHTAGTGSQWFEHSKAKNLKSWINSVQKRVGG